MELRQLEYFQMASRLKNITRAAERLRVSQPNITVAIKKLEAELGIQLFDRSQKQLSLTPEGTVFLGRVEVALRNIQDAVLEVNDYKQLQKGTIKIGIPPMMGAYLFPKIFSSSSSATSWTSASSSSPTHRRTCSCSRWHAVRLFAASPRTATSPHARRSPCRTSRIITSSCSRRARSCGRPCSKK